MSEFITFNELVTYRDRKNSTLTQGAVFRSFQEACERMGKENITPKMLGFKTIYEAVKEGR
jgi:hypothetical protein